MAGPAGCRTDTASLSREAAGWVDRQVAPFAHQLSAGRVKDLVDAALLRIDLTDPDAARPGRGRGVDFTPVDGGQVYLRALLDAVDGTSVGLDGRPGRRHLGRAGRRQ